MANPPAKNSGGSQFPQLSQETLEKLLTVQSQELSIRLKEIERDNAEISLNKSVAQQSIDAQERDRRHDREEQTRRQTRRHFFILAVTVLFLGFGAYVIQAGHGEIAKDLLKIVLGFLGGMGYQAYKDKRTRKDEEEE